jgi:hypothetical protein
MEPNIRDLILKELPGLITQDPQIRDWVWHIVHDYAPSRVETESRFDKMLAELQRTREEQERRWAENQRRWEENQRRWEENQRALQELREEGQRRWEENQRALQELREEGQRRWEENQRALREFQEEEKRRWEENQQQLREMLAEIRRVDRRIDHTIGALGARWGQMSEAAFRNGLRGILEESFGVKVERVEYRDESGEVFGRPDTVELDVLIYNGQLLVCEIKASVSRDEVYTFERKVRSYEKRVGRKADRVLLISPMILERDQELARALGIEVYTDVQKVKPSA